MLSHFKPLDRQGVLEHGLQIVSTWQNDMRELEAILPAISMIPTLIVWGSLDRTVDPASAARLAACFESVDTAVIDGAGHLPYEECPEDFLEVVGPFLQQSVPSDAREVT
jgi:pimeloyl-ACP methyl ester carboxylesterase